MKAFLISCLSPLIGGILVLSTSVALAEKDRGGADAVITKGGVKLLDFVDNQNPEFFNMGKYFDNYLYGSKNSDAQCLMEGQARTVERSAVLYMYYMKTELPETPCYRMLWLSAKVQDYLDLREIKDRIEYSLRLKALSSYPINLQTRVMNQLGIYEFLYSAIGSEFKQPRSGYNLLNSKSGRLNMRKEFKVPPLIWYFSETPLEEIDDEGAIRLLDESTKQQLAIQSKGRVIVYKPLFELMDLKSKAGLALHEAFVQLVLIGNPSLLEEVGTQPIRKIVDMLLKELGQYVPPTVLMSAYEELGLPYLVDYFHYETRKPIIQNGVLVE